MLCTFDIEFICECSFLETSRRELASFALCIIVPFIAVDVPICAGAYRSNGHFNFAIIKSE